MALWDESCPQTRSQTPRTCRCELTGKQGPCRCNQVKRSFLLGRGWLSPMAGVLRDSKEDAETQREGSQVTTGRDCSRMSRCQGARRIAAAAGRGKEGSSPRGFGGVRSCPLGFILRCWTPEARENECLLCQPPAYDTLLRAAPGSHAGSSQLTWCPNACDLEALWALRGSGSPFQDHFVIFRVAVHLSSPTQAHTPASQVPRFVPLGTPPVRPASISLGFVIISAACSS